MIDSRIDMIALNGGDGEHYNMQTELDNKYLVLKWDDINNTLNNSETRKLAMMLKKISIARAKDDKGERDYVVVSDSLPMYEEVYQTVLDLINGAPYETTNAKVYKAVEASLLAEREKIKSLIPTKKVVIIPDPEQPDEEISDKAVKIAEIMIPEETEEVKTAVELAKEVIAENKKNAKNKS